MTGQININMVIRKRKFCWIGRTLLKDDSLPLQGSSAMESTRYKRKGKAKKFMAMNDTE
jgi:hypothetical protein